MVKNIMIVQKIRNKITSEIKRKEIKRIKEINLPDNFKSWVIEYEKAGGKRDRFIWKIWYDILNKDSFPVLLTSHEEYKESSIIVKFLLTMFVVQLDDIADNKLGRELLSESFKVIIDDNHKISNLNNEERRYIIFTKKIWNFINNQIKEYPHYSKLNELFNFDILQIINTIRYSSLVNNNYYLMNQTESWLYYPNNMAFMPASIINLMYSKDFKFNDIGHFREIIYKIQLLGRISNWTTTWQRELCEKDFTSNIYIYLVEKEILSIDELETMSKDKIINIIKQSDVEEYYFKKWEHIYNDIEKKIGKIEQIDSKTFLEGQEYLLYLDLISYGYK